MYYSVMASRDEVKHRLAVTEFLLPLLLNGIKSDVCEAALKQKAAKLGLFSAEKNIFFGVLSVVFRSDNGEHRTTEHHVEFVNAIMRRYVSCESFFINDSITTLAFFGSSDFKKLMRLPLKELIKSSDDIINLRCSVGASSTAKALSGCSSAFAQAAAAQSYAPSGQVSFIDDCKISSAFSFDYIEKAASRLERLLKTGTKKSINAFFKDLHKDHESYDLLVTHLLSTVYRTANSFLDKDTFSELINTNPIYSRPFFYGDGKSILPDIAELCFDANAIISRNGRKNTEILCEKALEIIDIEYGRDSLSLAEVSSRLSISPNYLSALIKKNTQKTFTALLTERRMTAAFDMLTCSKMKILEISEKCGYNDQHYFSCCFKRYFGQSPGKMRQSQNAEKNSSD